MEDRGDKQVARYPAETSDGYTVPSKDCNRGAWLWQEAQGSLSVAPRRWHFSRVLGDKPEVAFHGMLRSPKSAGSPRLACGPADGWLQAGRPGVVRAEEGFGLLPCVAEFLEGRRKQQEHRIRFRPQMLTPAAGRLWVGVRSGTGRPVGSRQKSLGKGWGAQAWRAGEPCAPMPSIPPMPSVCDTHWS